MNWTDKLLNWYYQNKRDLPWRETRDPYFIWISEIILQQTTIRQGIPYYEKFIKKYPNLNLLAKTKEEELLKLWQGLGYYNNQEWDKAIETFIESDKYEEVYLGRKTNPSQVFINRSKELKNTPPSKDWDGTYALGSK